MATSKTISQLSVLVTAHIAGAVSELKNFEEIGKAVGPSVAKAFKNSSASVIESYDKMLTRISKSFANNNFSKTSVDQLDKLRQFYADQEKVFGEEARVRATHVEKLSQLFTLRHLRPVGPVQGLGMPDPTPLPPEIKNAFKRIDKIQSAIGMTDDVTPLISKLNVLNESLERMARQGLPLAASGLARVNDLMREARQIGGPAYIGSEFLPQVTSSQIDKDNDKRLKLDSRAMGMRTVTGDLAVHGPYREDWEAANQLQAADRDKENTRAMGMRAGDALGDVGPSKKDFLEVQTKTRIDALKAKIKTRPIGSAFNERIQNLIDEDDMAGLYAMRDRLEEHREAKTAMGGKAKWTHHRRAAIVAKAIAVAEAKRQQEHDLPLANSALPGVITPEEVERDLVKQREKKVRDRIKEASGNYSYKGGGLHEADSGVMRANPDWTTTYYGPSPFEKRIGRNMNTAEGVQELREIRDRLQKKVDGGNKKLQKQLDRVDRALKSKRATSRYKFHGSDASGHVTDSGPGGLRRGRGSASRQFRYVSSNLAYGAEDAIVSYGIGGIAGATRAATNNLTAVAGTMIQNPGMAAGAIVGISVLGAAIPPMIKWIEESHKGKDATEAFMDSYDKLSDKLKDGIDFEKLIKKGSADKLKATLEETITELEKLDSDASVLTGKAKEQREKQAQSGGFSKYKTNTSMLGFSMQGNGFLDERLLTVIDDVNWLLTRDANNVSNWTGEKHGEFSRKRKAALTAETNVEKSLEEKGKLAEEAARKQKQIPILKARLEKRKVEEEMLATFKEGRGDVEQSILAEEKARGEKMTEKEFLDRLHSQKKQREGELWTKSRKLGMDQNSDEYKSMLKEEEKFFAKAEKEGLRDIRLREAMEATAKRQGEEKRVFDNNRNYGNDRMRGEKGEKYDRWFEAKTREEELQKMPDSAKKQALLALNKLDFDKGEKNAWERDHPYERKPINMGIDVGSLDEAKLKNHYSLGKVEDSQKKEIQQSIKNIEAYLQEISGNTADRTEYKPKKA